MIAIVTYMMPCFMVAYAVVDGFTVATTVCCGKELGAGDGEGYRLVRNCGFAMIASLGMILAAALLILAAYANHVLKDVDVKVLHGLKAYAVCLAAGMFPWCLRGYQCALYAASGHTKPSYVSSAIFVGVKMVLQMMALAAGLLSVNVIAGATAISMSVSLIFTGLYARRYKSGLFPSLEFKGIRIRAARMLAVAMPIVAGNVIGAIEAAVTVYFFSGYGSAVLAGLSLIERFRTNALFPVIAAGAGISIFVAQNYGAKKYGRTWNGIIWSFKTFALGYGIVSAIGLISVHGILLLLAGDAAPAIDFAENVISVELIAYPLLAMGIVAQGAFEGLGKTYPNMLTLIIVVIFGRLLPYQLFLPVAGPYALKYILPWSHALHVITALLLVLHFKRFGTSTVTVQNNTNNIEAVTA